jgi:hypothetical protein
MHANPRLPRLSRLAKVAVSLELVLSAGALAGGAALILGPQGEILPLPMSALRGSPFDSYLVPGLILFSVLGLGALGAASLVWRRHELASVAAFMAGAALLIWVSVQIALIGYSNEPPLQALYMVLGAALTAVGVRWLVADYKISGSPLTSHVTRRH